MGIAQLMAVEYRENSLSKGLSEKQKTRPAVYPRSKSVFLMLVNPLFVPGCFSKKKGIAVGLINEHPRIFEVEHIFFSQCFFLGRRKS